MQFSVSLVSSLLLLAATSGVFSAPVAAPEPLQRSPRIGAKPAKHRASRTGKAVGKTTATTGISAAIGHIFQCLEADKKSNLKCIGFKKRGEDGDEVEEFSIDDLVARGLSIEARSPGSISAGNLGSAISQKITPILTCLKKNHNRLSCLNINIKPRDLSSAEDSDREVKPETLAFLEKLKESADAQTAEDEANDDAATETESSVEEAEPSTSVEAQHLAARSPRAPKPKGYKTAKAKSAGKSAAGTAGGAASTGFINCVLNGGFKGCFKSIFG